MIKAAVRAADGRNLVLLGLSDENIARLRDGQPIKAPLDDFGLTCDVVIFTGTDEQALLGQLMEYGLVGPDTKMTIDPDTIPDHPPAETRDVVDSIILRIPDHFTPDGQVQERAIELQAWMREQAIDAIKAQKMPNVAKIEITQLVWTLTTRAEDIAGMPPPHDCLKCREGMAAARLWLAENPGKWLAVGRAEYRQYLKP